ncbi:hypothetical protein HDU83_003450 [Entophlyctis luteolus]|nr:hypothetical protein HDU83_003450 [Entophlyctis luteolus]KAJ3393469.1 hypothetical protein HDU84_001960 [Entophlyctis sp. JEL0112]
MIDKQSPRKASMPWSSNEKSSTSSATTFFSQIFAKRDEHVQTSGTKRNHCETSKGQASSKRALVIDTNKVAPSFPKMVTPAQLKIGLLQVLENELPSPLKFYDFLKREHSEENIEFYNEVKKFKLFVTETPESVEKQNIIKSKSNEIIAKFVAVNSEKELNLNSKIRAALQAKAEAGDFSPDMFQESVDHICTTMRLSSFPSFYRDACGLSPGNRQEQL